MPFAAPIMFVLLTDPIVLAVLMSLIARGYAEIDYSKLFFIAVGISAATIYVTFQFPGLAPFGSLAVAFGLCLVLVVQFCYVPLGRAAAVSFGFLLFKIVQGIVAAKMLAPAG